MGAPENSFELTFHKGKDLFREGDEPDHLYIIKYGEVGIFKIDKNGQEVMIDTVGEGNVIGEMALFDDNRRSATVRANRLTRVVRVPRKEFLKRINKMPGWLASIVRIIIKRLRSSNSRLTESANRRFSGNISYLLTYIAERYCSDSETGVTLKTDTATKEIQKVLNLDYNTVKDCYDELAAKKIITLSRNKMMIPDPNLLYEYYRYKEGLLDPDALPKLSTTTRKVADALMDYAQTRGTQKKDGVMLPYMMFCKDCRKMYGVHADASAMNELASVGLIAITPEPPASGKEIKDEDKDIYVYTEKLKILFRKTRILEMFAR